MLSVVGCVLHQHDLRVVGLAAFLCLLSCFTATALLSRAQAAQSWLRLAWIMIAGVEFGGGVWSLHFIAMLGFMPGLAISYDVQKTVWSIVIVTTGAFAAFSVALSRFPPFLRVVTGGTLLVASVGGMHYVGIDAMRLHGRFAFDREQVAVSLLACSLFGAGAVCAMSTLDSLSRRLLVTALLSLSIALTHFIGMSAMSLQFGLGSTGGGSLVGSQTLIAAVGSISGALLLISLSVSMMDQYLTDRRAREERKFRKVAYHDPLTGVGNRLLLSTELTRALCNAEQHGTIAAVLCLDLDRFKIVNDSLGHAAGDELLRAVSHRLVQSVRHTDFVARLGGDEFAILLPGIAEPAACIALAHRIIDDVSEPVVFKGQQVDVGLSIGIAFYPQDGQTAEELLRRADVALCRAKQDKRGSVRVFAPEMDAALQQQRTLERDLRLAVGSESLKLHYQPLVACDRAEIEGYEALLRWEHPTRGNISPSDFIPIAERSGLIVSLGWWVLNEACSTAATWDKPLRVAVNLSPMQFKQSDLVEQIALVLDQSGLKSDRLEVEITEGVLIDAPERAIAILLALRNMGVRVSLDDFGTGFSSLSYLRQFPLDKIKIDKSFIEHLGRDHKTTEIVRSIVLLAHSLDLSVTAEGVETAEQLKILQSLSCNQVQGYLLGRPARLHGLDVGKRTANEEGAARDRSTQPNLSNPPSNLQPAAESPSLHLFEQNVVPLSVDAA